MRMYTNKGLYSVLARLAPFKERFRAAAGCNTKNAYGIQPLNTSIAIRKCARADSSCITAEKQVDMFHAITAAARGGHHFIYTVYLCVIASYIVKFNDAL